MQQVLGFLAFFVLVVGSAHASKIYRCEIDGELVFSQVPCEPDAEEFQVEPGPAAASQRPSQPTSPPPLESGMPTADENTRYVERVRLERRIIRHEKKITQLQRSRDAELALLRNRMQRANNNLAGATWLEAISTEMQAVTDTYSSQIEIEQNQIDRLREDIDRLR
jgi:hypothetical protein